MSLRIRDTLFDGISRTTTRSGLALLGAYLLAVLFQTGFVVAVTTTYLPLGSASAPASGFGATGPAPGTQLPPVVSLQAAFVAIFTVGVLTVSVHIVAIRTFVGGHTECVPNEAIFHRLGRATVRQMVGRWLVSLVVLAVSVGCLGAGYWGLSTVAQPTLSSLFASWSGRAVLALFAGVLLFPAAFVGVRFLFVGHEIAVRDKSVVGALAGSWRLTRPDRRRLLVLAVVLMVPYAVVSLVTFAVLSPAVAQVVLPLETGVLTIFVVGVTARAYAQVADIDADSVPFADG